MINEEHLKGHFDSAVMSLADAFSATLKAMKEMRVIFEEFIEEIKSEAEEKKHEGTVE